MPRTPRRPSPFAWQVFTTRQALDHGLTENHLRSAAWQRLFRGAYADSRLRLDHGLRCRAMALLMPAGAAIAGLSAAWLHGVEYSRTFDPVEVLSPRKFGPVQGARIRIGPLLDEETCQLPDGVAVTTPARTSWDVATQLDLVPAVKVLDALLRLGVVKPHELQDTLQARERTRGRRKVGRAFRLVDGRAASFPESELRVRLVLAGVPLPVPQYEVRVGGEFVARVDLAWPEHRVALEYDGAHHAEIEQMRYDRRRLNRLLGAGWIVLHATGDRLRDDFDRLLAEVHAALAHRRQRRHFA